MRSGLGRSRYELGRYEARSLMSPEEQAESDRIDQAMMAERREQGRLWAEELERRLRPAEVVEVKVPRRRRPPYARLALDLAALGLGLRRRR